MSVPGVQPPPPMVFAPPPAPARRPPVLDAARTALIPLRPLTLGEILDGAFLVVRRNIKLMVGLPLVIAGALAVYLLAGAGLWVLLGNTTAQSAQIVLVVLMGLFGLLLFYQCTVWMTAVLCRVSLQTVLGEGFAPSEGTITLRSALSLFWPMLGLSLLQYVAVSAIQTVIGIIYYAVLIGVLISGDDSEATAVISSIVLSLITFAALALAYGYLSLTVPALAVESKNAPGWIGKPAKPTNLVTAFVRSVQLIGLRNALRVALLFSATGLICLTVISLLSVGVLALVVLFATSINIEVAQVLLSPWTSASVTAFSVVLAMSALLAFVAAMQSLLYLDLRMRREGLDLALRFDRVPVPQPSAPPPVWIPYGPPPPGPHT